MTPAKSLLLSSAAAAALAIMPARAEVVGTAGAVNPASVSVVPAGPTRVIEIGAQVVHRERIRTSGEGSVQLVFIDKTSINIGPNSDLVIDEFVYDPKTSTGRMAATLAKGALRFVGGGASHTGGATLSTPAATIGVRGGVESVAHAADTGTFVVHHFGTATVTTPQGTQTIRRPDFAVRVNTQGEATRPARVQPAELAGLAKRLTSAPGQSGGSRRRPTDALAVELGLGTTTAPVPPGSTPSVQTQTVASKTGSKAATPPPANQQAEVNRVVQQGAQVQTADMVAQSVVPPPQDPASPRPEPRPPVRPPPTPTPHGPPPVSPPPVTPPPVTPPPTGAGPPLRFYALAMTVDPSLGSGAPYLPAGFVAPSGTFYNSPILGVGRGGQNPDGSPNRASRFMQAGLNITGSGASQVSTLYLATGVADSAGFNGLDGGVAATTRRSASLSAGSAGGDITALGANLVFDANYVPISANITQNGYVDGTGAAVPQFATFSPSGGVPGTNYAYSQTATAVPLPAGVGAHRPEAELIGFSAGMMRTFSKSAGAPIGPSFQVMGAVAVNLTSDDRFSAVMSAVNMEGNDTPGEFSFGSFAYGYLGPGSRSGRGVYVDYDNFAARETRLKDRTPVSIVNGQAIEGQRALMVTSKTVNPGTTFLGANTCRCEYTRWGFWSSDTTRKSGGSTYQDILHLGTWVAGRQTDPVNMPVTGTATYAGHVVASFRNGSNEYVAAGNMGTSVNFGNRTGSVSISNLDSRNYSGSIVIPSGSNVLVGNLTGTGLNAPQMDLQGFFYDGPRGPAREIGGWVSISDGAVYRGSGTFAGAVLP
jgi:hypothetical protein